MMLYGLTKYESKSYFQFSVVNFERPEHKLSGNALFSTQEIVLKLPSFIAIALLV